MEDDSIVNLYWARSENAISETSKKYGDYCYSIAYGILGNAEDAAESVNDTYLDAWNAIPPHRPTILSTFLGKITRRISIDKWRRRTAEKRGGNEITLALDELDECIPTKRSVEEEVELAELAKVIDRFVMSLPPVQRRVFICRYWYLDSISAISQQFGFSQSKVKMMLHRQRMKLEFRAQGRGGVGARGSQTRAGCKSVPKSKATLRKQSIRNCSGNYVVDLHSGSGSMDVTSGF